MASCQKFLFNGEAYKELFAIYLPFDSCSFPILRHYQFSWGEYIELEEVIHKFGKKGPDLSRCSKGQF